MKDQSYHQDNSLDWTKACLCEQLCPLSAQECGDLEQQGECLCSQCNFSMRDEESGADVACLNFECYCCQSPKKSKGRYCSKCIKNYSPEKRREHREALEAQDTLQPGIFETENSKKKISSQEEYRRVSEMEGTPIGFINNIVWSVLGVFIEFHRRNRKK